MLDPSCASYVSITACVSGKLRFSEEMHVIQVAFPSSHSLLRSHVSVERRSQVQSHVSGKLHVQWVRRFNQAVSFSQAIRFCEATFLYRALPKKASLFFLKFDTSFRAHFGTSSVSSSGLVATTPREVSDEVPKLVRKFVASHPLRVYTFLSSFTFLSSYVSVELRVSVKLRFGIPFSEVYGQLPNTLRNVHSG